MTDSEYGLCECGCGRPTSIAKKTRSAIGHVKGEPTRYIFGHQQRGKPAPNRRTDPPGMRRCARCDQLKEVAGFYPDKRYGFRFWCKACDSESRRHARPWSLRFLNYIGDETENGCVRWTGAPDSAGYGVLSVEGTPVRAHRIAYWLVKGPIPKGHHVHHTCRNKLCVNPKHLEVLTESEHHRLHAREKA